MSKFLDLQGLKVYDEKLKRYINQKTEEISGIPTSGEKGFSLVSNGQGNTPIWQEPSGYLVNTDSDNTRTVACENFILTKGVQVTIKFTTAFTSVGSASLNINNTGVIPLKWKDGTNITSANSWSAGDILTVCYNGSEYIILSSVSDNLINAISLNANAVVNALKNALLDYFIPVGRTIVLSNPINPATIYGGTWVQETETFIYGASDINSENPDYVGGDTGGNNDAVVVAHSHEASTSINVAYGSDSSTPGSAAIGLVQNSTFGIETVRRWSATTGIDITGEDGTGKNMPKYKVKYIWTRTA